MRSARKQSGFTLIELLTVISIIGLLGSVVLSSLSAARARARDAKRISDMSTLRTVITAYNIDTEGTSAGGAPLFTHAGVNCGNCNASGVMRATSDDSYLAMGIPGTRPWSEFLGDLSNYLPGTVQDPLDGRPNPATGGTFPYRYLYAVFLNAGVGTQLYDLPWGACTADPSYIFYPRTRFASVVSYLES